MEWQPIETAPKDGTLIFLYSPSHATPMRSAVQSGRWHQPANPAYSGFWTPIRNATHWAKIVLPNEKPRQP